MDDAINPTIHCILQQVRAMQRPPNGVRITVEAVCIMKGVKAKKVAGDKPGVKVDDYWEPGKALLQDPGKFLDSLFTFDKVSFFILYFFFGERMGRGRGFSGFNSRTKDLSQIKPGYSLFL